MKIILKPNEKQMETLSKVSKITGVDYDGLEYGQDITIESLFDALADMICECHNKEEQVDDMIQDINDNYEPRKINPYDEYGVSEKDFR